MLIIRYVKRLFSLWITIIFTVIDLIAYIISASTRSVELPSWLFWVIGSAGFIIANIQLYAQQENKIRGYEAEEADLLLNFSDTYMFFESYGANREGKRIREGLIDDTNIPYEGYIVSKVTIENLGKEYGVPEVEICSEKSQIPDYFQIDTDKYNKYILGNELNGVEGRDRVQISWFIHILFAPIGPEDFIDKIKINSDYRLVFQYRTKRIGSLSKPKEITIQGNADTIKIYLLNRWGERNLTNLIELLQNKAST